MPAGTVQDQNAAGLRARPSGGIRSENASAHDRPIPSDKDLGALLSSAVLAADKELGNIVGEIDRITKALKSDDPDVEALRVAVHPAVWCAVKHAIVERELGHLALTDDLTYLYNRRGFFAAATHQLKLARRNGQSVLLLFCDVDGLGKINDSFGQREGDQALVRVADALKEAFRDSDIVARLNGDEFAVLAPDASDRNQQALLRRLRKRIEKSNANESHYQLSVSIGAAQFDPKLPITLGELIVEADRAMQEGKRAEKSGTARPWRGDEAGVRYSL
jgi:diguanylate cyclase (GGDEF)-like protein